MTNKEKKAKKISNSIRIPKYKPTWNVEESKWDWEILYEFEYIITYQLRNKRSFKVIVNGVVTNRIIKFNKPTFPWKDSILWAISDYVNGDVDYDKKCETPLSFYWFYKSDNAYMKKNVKRYLLPINKEMNRDNLTKYKLI